MPPSPFIVGDSVKIRHGNGILVATVIEIREDQKAVVAVEPDEPGGAPRIFTRALAFLEPADTQTPTTTPRSS